jgi:transcriptional regulator with XRE-family HTH domain
MPKNKHQDNNKQMMISALIGDFIADAPEEELEELVQLQGGNSLDYIEGSKRSVLDALEHFAREEELSNAGKIEEANSLSLIFGKLLILLRRKEGISEEELAQRACVEADEILRIEYDPKYIPSPRTTVQLEKYFNLPNQSLIKLSGAVVEHADEYQKEITRYAAKMKSMDKLNSEEKELLNSFVDFLSKNS